MKVIGVIPARMGSSRFPGKPMEKMLGLEMIRHIFRRARLFGRFDRLVVATCDQEIFDCISQDGGEAIMTSTAHLRCTDRVEEAIRKMDLGLKADDFVLMIQGDEIFVSPGMLKQMVDSFESKRPSVVNLVSRLYRPEDFADINTVKVVTDISDRVLYMSRSALPSQSRGEHEVFQQTGIIGFAYSALCEFSALSPTPLEKTESVDMLRFIEHSRPVQAIHTQTETIGIDTPADLQRAEKLLENDPLVKQYLK